MHDFIEKHSGSVIGTLSGFDRLRFRGTLRTLAYERGMMEFLWRARVKLKEFGAYAQQVTAQVRRATEQIAAESARGRVVYLRSTKISKEDLARRIAREQRVSEGLVAVLSGVEPCRSFDVHRSREQKRLQLVCCERQCLHYYFYFLDARFGLMHVRLQTWFPFTVHVCLNGREWLARQMDAQGIGYVRRDNCFLDVADLATAQRLFDGQLRVRWKELLWDLVRRVHPAHAAIFGCWPEMDYYWSVNESEWASDVLFRSPAALARLYPKLVRHGICTFSSTDAMRFLGRKVPAHGGVRGNFQGEVITDLKHRPEGLRIKHRVKANSIKMYDKQGSVLRIETTINDPADFQVYRPREGEPAETKQWRPLRRGVADLQRRAAVSQAANQRYLTALAAAEDTRPVGELARNVCRPVTRKGRRSRALNPLAAEDARLLQAVCRGEFAIQGFRNRDLHPLLFGSAPSSLDQRRRRSGQITRRLRLLRAHGLIRKVPQTHRYLLTEKGRTVITALLAVREANTKQLTAAA